MRPAPQDARSGSISTSYVRFCLLGTGVMRYAGLPGFDWFQANLKFGPLGHIVLFSKTHPPDRIDIFRTLRRERGLTL